MGATNVVAAYVRYAGRVPPLSMVLLAYMAVTSKDTDEWPFFRLGQHALAEIGMGRPNPTDVDLRAVQRALKPLLDVGAVTVDRSGAVRADGNVTARYRLNLTDEHDEARRKWEATPDGKRRMSDRRRDQPHPTKSGVHTRRNSTAHPTEFDGTPDGNRRPQEPVGTSRSEKTKEEGSFKTTSHPSRAHGPSDPPTNVVPLRTPRHSRLADENLTGAAARVAAAKAAHQARLAAGETA